jgi:hypothetical protein
MVKIISILVIICLTIFCSGTRSSCEKEIDQTILNDCKEAILLENSSSMKGDDTLDKILILCSLSYDINDSFRSDCKNPGNYLQGF